MITGMPRIAIAVEDFAAAVSTFRDRLGMPVFDLSAETVGSLGARVAICVPRGGSNIEIMSPGNPETPLSQSVQRFIDHRGEGHFALMLEAADPDLEAAGLLERGLNVLPRMDGAGGRDVHPNSTHGVLIRVYPTNSIDEALPPDWADNVDPSALTGIERVVLAVSDLDQCLEVYGVKFALDVSEPTVDVERGVRTALCKPPSGGVIELVAVNDAGKAFAGAIDQFLGANGEGIYALVLRSTDRVKADQVLAQAGIAAEPVAGYENIVELDMKAMRGARFWIVTQVE